MGQLFTALASMLWAWIKIVAFVTGVLFFSITIIAGLQLLGLLRSCGPDTSTRQSPMSAGHR